MFVGSMDDRREWLDVCLFTLPGWVYQLWRETISCAVGTRELDICFLSFVLTRNLRFSMTR